MTRELKSTTTSGRSTDPSFRPDLHGSIFSRFTCELNEMEEDIAPTDSRLRPDQRLMEEGRCDFCQESVESGNESLIPGGTRRTRRRCGWRRSRGRWGDRGSRRQRWQLRFLDFFSDEIFLILSVMRFFWFMDLWKFRSIRRGGLLTQLSLTGSNWYQTLSTGAKWSTNIEVNISFVREWNVKISQQ